MTVSVQRVRCPWCKRGKRSLLKDGSMRKHQWHTSDYSGGIAPDCDGSYRKPSEYQRPERS